MLNWRSDKLNIIVVGLGYVGITTAACLSSQGHQVFGLDTNGSKINSLQSGYLPIVEPQVAALLDKYPVYYATNYGDVPFMPDLVMVCVGTPPGDDGAPNMEYVNSAVREANAALVGVHQTPLILRSTVPIGTCERLMEAHPALNIMFVPEFLREGTAVDDFFSPPKAVIGYSRKDGLDQVVKVFSDTSDDLEFTGLREAESIKYVDNSWHAVKVAFTNEVSKILSAESCDAREVMRIFRTDTKLNLSGYYMKPGFAYGGSCLPKDLMALRHIGSKNKLDSPLLDAVDKSNKSIINYCLSEIEKRQPKSVLVSGITFKRNTDDLRNSPIIPVIKALLSKDIDVAFVDKNIVQSRLFGDNSELYDSLILSGATHLNAVAQRYDIHVLHQWQNATAELDVDIDLTTDSKSPNFIFNCSS